MKAKDKKSRGIKVSLKNIISFLAFIIIVLFGIIIYNYYLTKNEVFAKETISSDVESENIKISKASLINIDDIIELELTKRFVEVLENAGVFKMDEQGQQAFITFIKSIQSEG